MTRLEPNLAAPAKEMGGTGKEAEVLPAEEVGEKALEFAKDES